MLALDCLHQKTIVYFKAGLGELAQFLVINQEVAVYAVQGYVNTIDPRSSSVSASGTGSKRGWEVKVGLLLLQFPDDVLDRHHLAISAVQCGQEGYLDFMGQGNLIIEY